MKEYTYNGEQLGHYLSNLSEKKDDNGKKTTIGFECNGVYYKGFALESERDAEASMMKLVHGIKGTAQLIDMGILSGYAGREWYALRMPFYGEKNLVTFLRGKKELDEKSLVQLIIKMAEVPMRLEEIGICHNDIKPANILLDGEGNPVYIDFGIAFQVGAVSELYASNTGKYAAPEKRSGGTYNIQTDIFSFGVTCEEVLKTEKEMGMKYSSELASIIQRCVNKNPSERYSSFSELVEALNQYYDKQYTQKEKETFRRLKDDLSGLFKRLFFRVLIAGAYSVSALILVMGIYMRERPKDKIPLRPDGAPSILADFRIVCADISQCISDCFNNSSK